MGILTTLLAQRRLTKRKTKAASQEGIQGTNDGFCGDDDRRRRQRLPELIVLVRHGESEGNADDSLYRDKPDHIINLTPLGVEQAALAGEKLEREVFQAYEQETKTPIRRVHLTVSPFERTLQTAAALRIAVDGRIVRTDIEPRIREQEFGNTQTSGFRELRAEQRRIGRFWYRFPTGESGADVYGRVKSWWFESVLTVNDRAGYDPVDAMVVVTHGLTMRFVLMQLYGWSPTTFHSVWNAENCSMYVLRKSVHKPGLSPYVLDPALGDMPKSSIDVQVEFDGDRPAVRTFTLWDYLSIPTPRTRQCDAIWQRLQEQHPAELGGVASDGPADRASGIRRVSLMPFVANDGGDDVWKLIEARRQKSVERRSVRHMSTSGTSFATATASSTSSESRHSDTEYAKLNDADDEDASDLPSTGVLNPDEFNDPNATKADVRSRRLRVSQEFSRRIPESDYWQVSRSRPQSAT